MKTVAEIVAAIAELVGGDKQKGQEVAEAIRGDSNAKPVSQFLIDEGNRNSTAANKPKLKALEDQVKEKDERIAELETENGEIKAKAPDAKTIEDRVNASWQKKLDAEKAKREAAEQSSVTLRREIAVEKFIERLTTPDEANTRVKPAWARRVLATEHADRFVVRDDGTVDVLQVGETTAYDGKTLDDKIAALAADVRKTVSPEELLTGVDRGSGLGNRSGSGGGLTDDQLVEKKRGSGMYRQTI